MRPYYASCNSFHARNNAHIAVFPFPLYKEEDKDLLLDLEVRREGAHPNRPKLSYHTISW